MQSNWYYCLIMFGILFELRQNSRGACNDTETPCGPYGFRCLDTKTFQVCLMDDEEVESPIDRHECSDGFVCDEENQAYCSTAPVTAIASNVSCDNDRIRRALKDRRYEVVAGIDYFNTYNDNYNYDENMVSTTMTNPEEEMFVTSDISIDPGFDCEAYGFFADSMNHSLFWFCDVPANGEGYYLRHMVCGRNRVFDATRRACILTDTVRNYRQDNNAQKTRLFETKRNSPAGEFSCQDRRPGRYSDEENCQIYHYCLHAGYAPVEELTLLCPDETAYDPEKSTCSSTATYRCMRQNKADKNLNGIYGNDQPYESNGSERQDASFRPESETNPGTKRNLNNIYCGKPTRFREINDCYGFFICVGSEVMEMDCPEYYKFDDTMLKCVPENIAVCQ